MDKKTVLVTGCSTGIGFATASHLAEKGFEVLAGVRKERDMSKLKERHAGITPVILDVTEESDLDAVTSLIEENYSDSFHGVVNNAGVMFPAPLELADQYAMRKEMDVNYFGVVALTQKLLPVVKKVRGRVVNISSLNGRLPMPAVGNYSATKFALEAFTDVLRMEIRHLDVAVSLVEPGQIKTEIFQKALDAHNELHGKLKEQEHDSYGALMAAIGMGLEMGKNSPTDPMKVAESVYDALTSDKPKQRYVVGNDAQGFMEMLESYSGDDLDRQILKLFGLA